MRFDKLALANVMQSPFFRLSSPVQAHTRKSKQKKRQKMVRD